MDVVANEMQNQMSAVADPTRMSSPQTRCLSQTTSETIVKRQPVAFGRAWRGVARVRGGEAEVVECRSKLVHEHRGRILCTYNIIPASVNEAGQLMIIAAIVRLCPPPYGRLVLHKPQDSGQWHRRL